MVLEWPMFKLQPIPESNWTNNDKGKKKLEVLYAVVIWLVFLCCPSSIDHTCIFKFRLR